VQYLRVILQAAVGIIALVAIYLILRGDERRGITYGLVAVIVSLVALQLLTFYLDQFTAVLPTLFQFAFLLLSLQYRQWYLPISQRETVA
jgi:hypothetical protein